LVVLISGVLTLSVLHPLLPNHWLPLALIARGEGWNRARVLIFSFLISIAHSLSTVLLGIFVAFLGFSISEKHEFLGKTLSSFILIILGLFYLSRHFRTGNPHHHGFGVLSVSALLLAMFFSPCIEITPFYLIAVSSGWHAVVIISLIYILTSVILIPSMVLLSLKGLKLANLHILEHYEDLLIGALLILFGFINPFLK
jgi:nickel/cobalt exporter